MPLVGFKRKPSDIEPRGRSPRRKRSFILRRRSSTDSRPSRASAASRSTAQLSPLARLRRGGSLLLAKLRIYRRMALPHSRRFMAKLCRNSSTKGHIRGRHLFTTPPQHGTSEPSSGAYRQCGQATRSFQIVFHSRSSTRTTTTTLRSIRSSGRWPTRWAA